MFVNENHCDPLLAINTTVRISYCRFWTKKAQVWHVAQLSSVFAVGMIALLASCTYSALRLRQKTRCVNRFEQLCAEKPRQEVTRMSAARLETVAF